MSDGTYVGMTGAVARSEQLDAISDNLANAQTPGFKAARPAFETFLPAAGSQDKAYPAAVATGFDLRPGSTLHTGNGLDVFVEGRAFLAVQTPEGKAAFTRDGRITVDADGHLRAGGGLLLGRTGQPIALPPYVTPQLDSDGTVRVEGRPFSQLAFFTLDGTLNRVGPSLLAPAEGGVATQAEAQVRVGEIEGANTSPLEAAIALVTAHRHFETSMQAIQTYRRLDDRAVEIGRAR